MALSVAVPMQLTLGVQRIRMNPYSQLSVLLFLFVFLVKIDSLKAMKGRPSILRRLKSIVEVRYSQSEQVERFCNTVARVERAMSG